MSENLEKPRDAIANIKTHTTKVELDETISTAVRNTSNTSNDPSGYVKLSELDNNPIAESILKRSDSPKKKPTSFSSEPRFNSKHEAVTTTPVAPVQEPIPLLEKSKQPKQPKQSNPSSQVALAQLEDLTKKLKLAEKKEARLEGLLGDQDATIKTIQATTTRWPYKKILQSIGKHLLGMSSEIRHVFQSLSGKMDWIVKTITSIDKKTGGAFEGVRKDLELVKSEIVKINKAREAEAQLEESFKIQAELKDMSEVLRKRNKKLEVLFRFLKESGESVEAESILVALLDGKPQSVKSAVAKFKDLNERLEKFEEIEEED